MEREHIDQAWKDAEKCRHCSIRERVLFAELKREDFDLLHRPIDEISLSRGQHVYRERDLPAALYTIRSGLVKLERNLADGNRRIVRLLRRGDLAGIEALNGTAYLQDAVALEDTEVCRIPVSDVERLNRHSTRLYRQLTARWQKIQSDADIWLGEFTVGSARKRLANLLLYLAGDGGDSFFLPSREDIGALLAITTETASRTIADFKRRHYLQVRGRYARIDRAELERGMRENG